MPRFPSILLIFLTCSVTGFQVLAQRPATGGAAPIVDDKSDISPVVFIVGGVAIAGATYALVKSKGAKVPVAEHLRELLLAHNILPNSDAILLMNTLNPSLNNTDMIRSKTKLLMPEFPEVDRSGSAEGSVDYRENLPADLQAAQNQFEISRDEIERMATQSNTNVSLQNMARVNSMVNQLEQEISSSRLGSSSSSTVMDQLVFDLLTTFNQTLDQVVANKNASSEELTLLQNIVSNLSEILKDVKMLSQSGISESHLPLLDLRKQNYLASIADSWELPETGPIPDADVLSLTQGLSKEFAFAVYKFSDTGQLITKGPEVEGRYKIKYVLPALKDIPNAYHSLRDPATYAVANFPPAKIFIVVEDFSGNQVSIQDQLVDFKVVYNNPQLVNPDKKIVVPLYITK